MFTDQGQNVTRYSSVKYKPKSFVSIEVYVPCNLATNIWSETEA